MTPEELIQFISEQTQILNEQTKYEGARDSLLEFARLIYGNYETPPHIEKIAEHLEMVEQGKIRRLVISMPPRSGKSLLLWIFEAWYLGRHPTRQIIHTSYSTELAEESGRSVRNAILDEDFQKVFPKCQISPDTRSAKRLNTTAKGRYLAVGMGGSVTGKGAHCFIVDDPLKDQQEADSPAVKNYNIQWYQAVANSRLMSAGRVRGAVIICATRWAEDDLTGWVLSTEGAKHENWTVLSLPAIAEPLSSGVKDPLGRKEGEPLWAERFPVDRLEEIKRTSGPRVWNALYQQRPSAIEGNILKREWWKKWTAKSDPTFIETWIGVDVAMSTKKKADFSAVVTISTFRDNNNATCALIREVVNKRMEFPDLRNLLQQILNDLRDESPLMIIESAVAGMSVGQELNRIGLPITTFRADTDKEARVNSITPLFEMGRVYYKETPGTLELIEQASSFPHSGHDDMVDAMTIPLIRLRKTNMISPIKEDDEDSNRPFRPRRGYW